MTQLTAEAAARSPTVPGLRHLFWTLGLGAFGLAFSITTTSVALPPILRHFTPSGALIGLVLGSEGVFALALSPVIGPWSDTFHTPLGRRRPFMLVALGLALVGSQFLLRLWEPAPFVTAAFVTTAACGAAILFVQEDGGHGRVFEGVVAYFKRSWR